MKKPSMTEVYAYARPLVFKWIHHYAGDAPDEHKEEMEQQAYLRLVKRYPELDPEQGWKSFVYNHTRGAVLDYLRLGKGFKEDKWSLTSVPDPARTPKLTQRVLPRFDHEDQTNDVDQTLGTNGVFALLEHDQVYMRWELLAKMASKDENLKAFLKLLLGYSIEEMAPHFNKCRTRVSQMIQEFVDRFDDPARAEEEWFKQTVFALGICRRLGMEEVDQSIVTGRKVGHALVPVDLDDITPHPEHRAQDAQMGFDFGEEAAT